ncbi:Uncharacterised protein [uncultured Eubacterium sp.]|nr:Uncharacterised protein [uncultured Eubacterium sp.]
MNNIAIIEVDKQGLSAAKRKISDLTSEVKKLRSETKKLQKTKVVAQVFLNEEKFNKSFAKTEKLLKQLTTSKFEVTVLTNDVKLQKVHSTIKELSGKKHMVHIGIDTSGAFSELNHLKGQLQSLILKKWNLTIFNSGTNKKNIPWGYAVGTANAVQPRIKQEPPVDTLSDVIGSTADILTFYTAADLIFDKITGKSKKNARNVHLMNKLLTKVGSSITKSGKFGLAAGSIGLKALSAGTVAGGLATAAGTIDGGYHLYKGITANNDYDRSYETAKGSTILGSTITGVAAGSIFGIPGILVGGGIGYIAGKAASSPIANAFTGGKVGAMKDAAVSPNAAKRLEELREKQAELAKSTLDEKFGSITLSAEQVAKATENLFNPTQTARIYNAEVAASQLNEAFGALQQSNSNLRKDIWIASTEGQLSSQKITDLKTSASTFGTDARTTLKEKQYADKEAVLAVMGNADESEGVLKSIDNRYKSQQTKLNKMETKLNTVINNAAADGKISEKEQSKIDDVMTEIDSLIKNNNGDEFKASLEKMDLDIKGDINWDSFRAIIESGKLSADQKVDSLETAYSNIASSVTDSEKKTLLWGENDKGDKAGLYYQESGMYLDVINSATEGFMERFAGNFDYFSESIDKIMQGGLNDDARKQISSLYEDDGAKKALGELTDGLSGSAQELLQIAQVYEDATGEVPKKIQEALKQLDFYNYVADDKAHVWLKENGGKNANKEFNLDDYMYMGQPSLQSMPQTVPQTIPQDGFAYSSGLPQAPQVTLDGKSIIEGQSSITAADFGIPPFITTTVDVYVKENRIIGDPPKGAGGVGSTIASAGYTLMEGAKKVLKKLNGFRGGIIGGNIPGYAEGGYVQGGAQLITVAEEGTPEAIIPLGKHRRKRAIELFGQVGSYLQAPGFAPKGFAAGGIVGGSISGGFGGGMPTVVEVGGVEIKVEAKDGQNLVETIRENKEAISEEIAGVFNAAFKGQFANTPASGGASA